MKNDYYDILARAGNPLWYDQDGVPRYDPFSPHLCGPHPSAVAYLEVACQNCQARFLVAQVNKAVPPGFVPISNPPGPLLLPSLWNYGDPPAHSIEALAMRCLGATMNSLPLRIIEFWRAHDHGWGRDPSQEGPFPDADLPEQYKPKVHDLCGDPNCTNPAHLKARDE